MLHGAAAQDVIRRTLAVEPGATVAVEADAGAIEVHVHARREVRLEVHRQVDASWGRLPAREVAAGFDVAARTEAGGVTVQGRYRRDAQGRTVVQGGEMSRLQARFVLYVPPDVDLRLKTGAGTISAGDVRGDVQAETGSGTIALGDVGGDVTAVTASGTITVGDVAGDAHLQTASGVVRTGAVSGRRTGTR